MNAYRQCDDVNVDVDAKEFTTLQTTELDDSRLATELLFEC